MGSGVFWNVRVHTYKYNCIILVSLGNQAKNPRQAKTHIFPFYGGYKRTNQKTEVRDYSEQIKWANHYFDKTGLGQLWEHKAGLGNILDMEIICSETPLEVFLLHICFEIGAAVLSAAGLT